MILKSFGGVCWMQFDKKRYAELFENLVEENRIKESREIFKIKLFLQKAENSIQIAKHVKDKNKPKYLYICTYHTYLNIIGGITE